MDVSNAIIPRSNTLGQRRVWLLILLLAFALRVAGLADQNIWWDEGWSASLARRPLTDILQVAAHDNHPPLHNLILRGWWLLVGDGEYEMRFPAVLFSLVWLALVYRLGRTLGGRRVGTLAMLLLALSRFAIAWAQSVRMYTWAALLTTAMLWAALELWRSGRWRAWLAYTLCLAGGLLSLYLTVAAPLTANLVFPFIWWRRGRPRRMLIQWLTAHLVAFVFFLPWMLRNLTTATTWAIVEPITLGEYLHLYATMLVVGVPLNLNSYLPLTLLGCGIALAGCIALWRTHKTRDQRAGLAVLALGLLVQAVVVYAICFGIVPGFARPLEPRYLLLLAGNFYVLMAWGIDTMGNGKWRRANRHTGTFALLLPVVFAALLGLWTFYPGRARRDDYTSIAETLRAYVRPDDIVVLYVDRDWPLFEAQYAGARHNLAYGAPLDAASAEARLTPLWQQAAGLWLVTTPEAQQTDPTQAIPTWLAAHALSWHTWIAGENTLTFYARTEARQGTRNALAPDFVAPATINARLGEQGLLLGATLPQSRYRTGDTARLVLYWAPPAGDVTVLLSGPETREIAAPAPAAMPGVTRQGVDIPLTPDLPGGRYQLFVVSGADRVRVGRFTLVRSAAGAAIALSDIPHRVDYRLGETIRLIGYDLPQTTVQPAGVIALTLYWQTSGTIPARYKVFTHLLGDVYNAASDNFLWGQQDNEPGGGQALTTLWTPGAIIVDTYRIPVAPNAPPGEYTLEIGMYGLVDAARLPVVDANGRPSGDAIRLTTVRVTTTD